MNKIVSQQSFALLKNLLGILGQTMMKKEISFMVAQHIDIMHNVTFHLINQNKYIFLKDNLIKKHICS